MTFDKENWKLVFKDYLWKPLLQDTSVPYANAKKIIVSDCDGVLTDGTSEIGYDTCGNIRKKLLDSCRNLIGTSHLFLMILKVFL